MWTFRRTGNCTFLRIKYPTKVTFPKWTHTVQTIKRIPDTEWGHKDMVHNFWTCNWYRGIYILLCPRPTQAQHTSAGRNVARPSNQQLLCRHPSVTRLSLVHLSVTVLIFVNPRLSLVHHSVTVRIFVNPRPSLVYLSVTVHTSVSHPSITCPTLSYCADIR
jgi:hypothetical protein